MAEEEKKTEEAIPELAPVEAEETAPKEKKKEETGGGDEYKMPTLKEVEDKEAAPAQAAAPEQSSGEASPAPQGDEGDHIDLDAHDEGDATCKVCPKCDLDYCGDEAFCTNCGAPVAKVRESVQVSEEIPKIKAEVSDGNVYKAPALEWHEDEPHTFEVACYNCQNVFDATVEKVPAIINCPQCQAQLQIEEIPPEEDEDDEEDMEITAKQPTIRKEKPPSKGCPKCGGKTRFIPRHFKWFCDSCRQWI